MKEAFTAYENVRHRLPAVARDAGCKQVAHLEEIADEIDVFLLDAFGVLNIGETAIEGVPERVARLQKAGKRVMVVSNAKKRIGVKTFNLRRLCLWSTFMKKTPSRKIWRCSLNHLDSWFASVRLYVLHRKNIDWVLECMYDSATTSRGDFCLTLKHHSF